MIRNETRVVDGLAGLKDEGLKSALNEVLALKNSAMQLVWCGCEKSEEEMEENRRVSCVGSTDFEVGSDTPTSEPKYDDPELVASAIAISRNRV
ncbi:hypothetical protein ACLOJK_028226 [Asimina triloba]